MHFFSDILAAQVGLHESIFLQNLYYLLKRRILEFSVEPNKDLWIKLSSRRLQEFQPYFTRSQFRTIVKNLSAIGFINSSKKHLDYSSNVFSYTLTSKGWAYMIFLDTYESQEKLKEVAKTVENQSWGKNLELWLFLAKSLAKLDNPWLKLNKDWQLLANIYIENRYLISNIDFNNNILNILDSTTDINNNNNLDENIDQNLDERFEKNEEDLDNKLNQEVIEVNNSSREKVGNVEILKNSIAGERALSPNPIEKIFLEENVNYIKNKSSFELEINKIFENSYEFKRKVLKTFDRVENFISKILYPSVKRTSYFDVIKALKKASENFFGYMSPVAEFFAILEGLK